MRRCTVLYYRKKVHDKPKSQKNNGYYFFKLFLSSNYILNDFIDIVNRYNRRGFLGYRFHFRLSGVL